MKTKTRRLLQSVWNIFDSNLTTRITSGIILCISGGSDSRALMESIACWPRRFHKIHVVSVDHRTREETQTDARNVYNRARILGFESVVLRLRSTEKKNEAFLRAERYQLIWEYAKKNNINTLVTAHTLDDQAESFVMDIVGYGGGAEGAGMPIETQHPPMGNIIRPFLEFSRAYLISILTALKIYDYVEDPTNQCGNGKRVLVRNFLKLHRFPKNRFAEIAKRRSLELNALLSTASHLITRNPDFTSIKLVKNVPEAIRFYALKQALQYTIHKKDLRDARHVLEKMAKLHGCSVYIIPDQDK